MARAEINEWSCKVDQSNNYFVAIAIEYNTVDYSMLILVLIDNSQSEAIIIAKICLCLLVL